ncbi:MAG: sulfatase-like hydrolase/transferase, partial [bacterium]
DQRADTLATMPRVMRDIAGQGIRFTNAFTATAICAPSRASIFSGLPVHAHGVLENGSAAPKFDPTTSFVPALSAAGYRTGLIGIYLAGNQNLGTTIPPGWSDWMTFYSADGSSDDAFPAMRFNHNGRLIDFPSAPFDTITDRLGAEAIRFIRHNADSPFFLQLAPFVPHAPSIPTERYSGSFAGLEPHRPPNFHDANTSLKPTWVRFMQTVDPRAEPTDQLRINQHEALLGLDDVIGEILDTVDALGLTNDTIVVFASDHGQHWGEHWWSSKMTGYEESIRIPLVLRYPRQYPLGRVNNSLVSTLDLSATFADAAGAEFLTGRGMSILAELEGRIAQREEIFVENTTNFIVAPSNAVRTKNWKYIATPQNSTIFEELYDIENDPFELQNLALEPAYALRIADLAARLQASLDE